MQIRIRYYILLIITLALLFTSISSASITGNTNACNGNFGVNGQNSYVSGWVGIAFLAVAVVFMIAAFMYAIGNAVASVSLRNKLISYSKAELMQGVFSIILIFILLWVAQGVSSVSCIIFSDIFSNTVAGTNLNYLAYADPFTASEIFFNYVLYNIGFNVYFNVVEKEGLGLLTSANYLTAGYNYVSRIINGITSGLVKDVGAEIVPELNIEAIQSLGYTFADFLLDIANPLVFIGIAMILIVVIVLPVIPLIAFTVILPVAIVIRSLSFISSGNLRKVADTFLSLAIGLYFVFPLTVAMDIYILNYVYCGNEFNLGSATINTASCNPGYYKMFLDSALPSNALNIVTSGYISSSSSSLGSVTSVPPSTTISQLESSTPLVYGANLLSGFGDAISYYIDFPSYLLSFIATVSELYFIAVFLLGLDVGIVIAFVQSLADSISGFITSSSIFGE